VEQRRPIRAAIKNTVIILFLVVPCKSAHENDSIDGLAPWMYNVDSASIHI
jgi:hypothetical protein